MQQHINDLDNKNALYQAENNKLRREVENLRVIEGNLRSTKSQLDNEKQIRTTAEFDIQKLRVELQDQISAATKAKNNQERQMNDLKY